MLVLIKHYLLLVGGMNAGLLCRGNYRKNILLECSHPWLISKFPPAL